MISHELRCIFIHIPRCGGTSIENALGHWAEHNGRGGQDHRTIRNILRREIVVKSNPRNRITVTPEEFHSYFKFTVIRNPWDRAYSWYAAALRDPVHRKRYGIELDIPFAEFLRLAAGKTALMPQTYWLLDSLGRLPFDLIGKFERLSEDFKIVCKALRHEVALPHYLDCKTDYRAHHTDETKQIIADVYAEEIDRFGFSF